MTENVDKKPGFEKKITLEILLEMKRKVAEMGETTHDARAARLASEYTQFTHKTLLNYARILACVCEEVFQMCVEGKISLTSLIEFVSWDKKTQIYMAGEYVEKELSPGLLRIIKQQKREHDMSWAEAIGRATGAIPMDKPRRPEDRKNLDQILTEIADKGARWRALVDMAIEMVGDEEAAAGVHMVLFEKVALLRELIGNQYDMVNGRFNRYMGSIKKRLRSEVVSQGDPKELIGEAEIVDSGSQEKGSTS